MFSDGRAAVGLSQVIVSSIDLDAVCLEAFWFAIRAENSQATLGVEIARAEPSPEARRIKTSRYALGTALVAISEAVRSCAVVSYPDQATQPGPTFITAQVGRFSMAANCENAEQPARNSASRDILRRYRVLVVVLPLDRVTPWLGANRFRVFT